MRRDYGVDTRLVADPDSFACSVSYDISKDGAVAAVLTLVKSKYRLGDSILGVVNINRVGAVARVVRVSMSPNEPIAKHNGHR